MDMLRKCYIYKIKSPSNKVYIGISYSPKHRLVQHKSDESSAIYSVIKKYGIENLVHEIIYVAFSREEAENKEIYFIDKYNSYKEGYNRTRGGEAGGGAKKLNKEKVKEIVKMIELGEKSFEDIGKCFNVRDGTIKSINKGNTWNYVTGREEMNFKKTKVYQKCEDKYNTELTNNEVVEIKKMIIAGEKSADIARKFNQKPNTIHQIKAGRNWKDIYVEGFDKVKSDSKCKNKITSQDAIDIRKLRENGMKTIDIGKLYNTSRSTISKIINFKTHKDA